MILLLGGGGYIGSAFKSILERQTIHVVSSPTRAEFDYTKYQNLLTLLGSPTKPHLVINCAAFITRPSVDLCEDHVAECIKGNLIFPALLRNVCAMHDIPLMHISTGCLYNGDNGGGGWTENDPPQLTFDTGAGYYVGCKQMAEDYVSKYEKAYCCRIRLPFDEFDDQRNYVSKLCRFLKVFEARNSLSHRGDFVSACLDLWQKEAPYGVYNMTNPGSIKTSEIVSLIEKHLLPGTKFNYWDEAEFLTKVARTPKSNCVLNVDKLRSVGIEMRSTREAVEAAIGNWVWNKNLCLRT